VKPPAAPGRKYTVEPVALAFVKKPKESVGGSGAVGSIRISREPTASSFPTES
jgi:hypothetical protein